MHPQTCTEAPQKLSSSFTFTSNKLRGGLLFLHASPHSLLQIIAALSFARARLASFETLWTPINSRRCSLERRVQLLTQSVEKLHMVINSSIVSSPGLRPFVFRVHCAVGSSRKGRILPLIGCPHDYLVWELGTGRLLRLTHGVGHGASPARP